MKSIRNNTAGALEGLPLYLIILVVIAAVAIVVIMNWMGSVQEEDLDEIEIRLTQDSKQVTSLETGKQATVTIYAKDQDGNALSGVSVHLKGAGFDKMEKTSGNAGSVTFKFTPELPVNTQNDVIDVEATYTGTIKQTLNDEIIVNAS